MTEENTGEAAPLSTEEALAAEFEPKAPITPADDAGAPEPKPEAEAAPAGEPKPKQTAQERIDAITAKHREAEREAEYWKAKATQPAQPQAQEQPKADADPDEGRPNPEDYPEGVYDPKYVEDLTDWKVDRRTSEHLARERHAQTIEQSFRQAAQTFGDQVKTHFPDGEPAGLKTFRTLERIPPGVAEVLKVSDVAPKIADYLGDNPDELSRLSSMTPVLQARELAMIEAKFTTPVVVPAKVATDAPAPHAQVRGQGGQFKVSADTDDFSAFEKAYP